MVKGRQYPAELRELAVRLVEESVRDGRGEWEAMRSIAEKLGVGSPEPVRKWVRTAQAVSTPAGERAAEESDEVKRLKAENRELRRTNEMADSTGQRNRSCEMKRKRLTGGIWCRGSMAI